MEGLALSGITTLLAIYVAGLFVLFQTSVSRYTIRLLPSWIRGVGYWPMAFLILLIVVVGIFNIAPEVYLSSIAHIPILQNQLGRVVVLLPLGIGFTFGALTQHFDLGGTRFVLTRSLPVALLLAAPDALVATTTRLYLPTFTISNDTRIVPFTIQFLLTMFLFLTPIIVVLVAVLIDELLCKLFSITSVPFLSMARPFSTWLWLLPEYNAVTVLAKQGPLLSDIHKLAGGLGLLACLTIAYFFWKATGDIVEERSVGGEKGDSFRPIVRGRAYIVLLALFLGLVMHPFSDWLMNHTNITNAFLLHGNIARGVNWDAPHMRMEWLFIGLLAMTAITTGGALQATLFRDNIRCLSVMVLLFVALAAPVMPPPIVIETLDVIPLNRDTLSLGFSLLSLGIVIAGLFKAWLFDDDFVFQAVANEVFRSGLRSWSSDRLSSNLRGADQALRETLSVLVNNKDESMVVGLVYKFLDTNNDKKVVDWFVENPDILQSNWLTEELVLDLTQYRITTYAMKQREPLLTLILQRAMLAGDIQQVERIVDSIRDMLFAVTPWGDRHSTLLRSALEIVRVNDSLSKHMIEGIIQNLRRNDRVWATKRSRLGIVGVIRRFTPAKVQGDRSLYALFHAVEDLINSAPIAHTELDEYFVYQLLYLLIDFVRNAYTRGLLSTYTLEKMFGLLARIEGLAQDISGESTEVRKRIQATTLDLCATLAALQQQGKTFLDEREFKTETRRYAYGIHSQNVHRQYWLPPQSYDAVLGMLPQAPSRLTPASNPTMDGCSTDIELDEELR